MNTIFISSTFRDMQHERDTIQHIVSPRVNAAARQYGQSVSFCDLRWGINTEGEERLSATQKIIDVCLDEIDRSSPPVVALLGYRYGWTPLVDGLGNNGKDAVDGSKAMEDTSLRKGMMLDDLEISVTELELRFGCLATDGKQMPILCYLREIEPEGDVPSFFCAEDDWHSKKLKDLKRRIYNLTRGRVRTYQVSLGERMEDDMRTFADMLTTDLIGMLRGEWETISRLTPYERTIRAHERLMHEKAGLVAVNEGLVSDYANRLTSLPGERVILEGESGVGKTTVASAVAERIAKAGNIPVLFLSCGTTADTTTANGILGILTQFLSSLLGRRVEQSPSEGSFDDVQDYRNLIEQLCTDLDMTGRKAVIIIDAVDQLVGAGDLEDARLVPSMQHDSMRMLLTTTKHFTAPGAVCEKMSALESDSDVLQVLASLEQRHAHEVSRDAKQLLVSKASSRNPLYISLVYQRLLMMWRPDFEHIHSMGGGIAARAKHEAEIVAKCPDGMAEMVQELFDEAGKRINPELTDDVVGAIAASRFGLRAQDFAAISPTSWVQVDFSHIINYLSESFILREDGRYDFSHKALRDALFHSPSTWTMQTKILDYLWELPEDDPIRVSEIAYHCIMADDHERFSDYIKWCHGLENQAPIEAAAECVYHQVHEDNGRWIDDFLNRRGPLIARMVSFVLKDDEQTDGMKNPGLEVAPDDWRIVAFICFYLHWLFGRDKQDGELQDRILGNCEEYAYAVVNEYPTPDSVYFMTIVGLRIAQLILSSSGVLYNPTLSAWYRDAANEERGLKECGYALRMLDKSIRVMTPLAKDVDTEQCWNMLACMYLWRVRALITIGSYEEADAAAGSCIEIWEKLLAYNPGIDYRKGLAMALADRARMLPAIGRVADAADCLVKALELMGDPNTLSSDDLMDYLAYSSNAAIMLCDRGGKESLAAAEETAQSGLALAESLAVRVGGSMPRVRLKDALHAYGYVQQAKGGYPRIRTAISYYAHAIDIAIEAYQASGSADDRLSCLTIIDQAVNLLHFLGDRKSVAWAGELLEKRSRIDARPGRQTMLDGGDVTQLQAEAEMRLTGDVPDTERSSSIVELIDESGEQALVQVIDRFDYRGQEYLFMLDVEEDDKEVFILAVTEEDGEEQFEAVDDDGLLEVLFELFKQRNEDFYDFVD